MKPTLASAPESRDRKCFFEHFVPGKPQPACLEVASGWSESLPGHLSIAKQPHPSLLAQLLLSPGCSKEFPPRENASLCCTWGTAPALPSFHPQLTSEFELFPLLPHSSSALLSYRRQLGPALGALYHSSHEQLFLAPLSFPGSRRECLLNYNGEKPPLLRTGWQRYFSSHGSCKLHKWADPARLDPALLRRAPKPLYTWTQGLSTGQLGKQLHSPLEMAESTVPARVGSGSTANTRRSAQKAAHFAFQRNYCRTDLTKAIL